jgi:excisionase family DNA binding protein
MVNDAWLTVNEAAKLAGYHPDHIRRLIRAGEIEAQKFSIVWQVSHASLLQYIQRSQAQGEKRGPKSEKN